MPKRLAVGAVLLICAFALGAEEALYQIDLVPTGKAISKDLPQLKGTSYLFHEFPTGTLISVKKSTVKRIIRMSPEAVAAVDPKKQLLQIRDLPMQGPKASGGGRPSNMGRARAAVSAANAGTAGRTSSPD